MGWITAARAGLKFAPWIAIAALSAYIVLLRAQKDAAEANELVAVERTVTLQAALSDQNNKVERLVADLAAERVRREFHQDRAAKAERERDREIADLNAWRTKLSEEIYKRPEVVARAGGLAFRRVLLDIERAGGSAGSEPGNEGREPLPAAETESDNRAGD